MSRFTGSEIVVKYLIKEGVKYVFGIPGHGCLPLTDAFFRNKDKIQLIQPKQEMSGVHCAVGYYRITGKPLMVFTSIGPGAINTAIGLADAYVDSMPVLVINGDTHVHMRGKGVLQEIERTRDSDMPRILEPIVKRNWQVSSITQIPTIMQRAFNVMMTGRRGPVVIDLPMDVQAEATEVEIPEPLERRPTGRTLGDPSKIKEAVNLLKEAKRPVIFLGGGVITAEATEEVKILAEKIGAAVVVTMMAKDAFPNDHPLFCWSAGSKGTTIGLRMTSSSDVILAVGCRFADETSSSYKDGVSFSIPPTKLIQIDIDPHEIGKNYPIIVGINGDAKACLNQILEDFGDFKNDLVDYRNEILEEKKKWDAFLEKNRDDTKVPVMISTVIQEIRKFFDRDAVIVTSSGNIQAQMLQELEFYEPRTCITAGGFSTMGYTLPAAIGAKLGSIEIGKPNRQVVGLAGDGEFMMTLSELTMAVQLGLENFFIIVLNNAGWIAIKDLQQAAFGEDRGYGTAFTDKHGNSYTPDFAKVGEAFGCYSERISKKEEIIPALERASKSGKPALVEIMVNQEYPFTGSPAMGWWDVPIPEYLTERRKKYEEERKGRKTLRDDKVGEPKTVKETQVEVAQLMLPEHANPAQNVHGGTIMKMIDEAGAIVAARHANHNVVTVSVDKIDFLKPAFVGNLVIAKASLNFVSNTSMEVGVRVEAEHILRGTRKHTSSAYLTYVALDNRRRPTEVPKLICETEEEKKRFEAGKKRREKRLKARKKKLQRTE